MLSVEDAIFKATSTLRLLSGLSRFFDADPSGDQNFDNLCAAAKKYMAACIGQIESGYHKKFREELQQKTNRSIRFVADLQHSFPSGEVELLKRFTQVVHASSLAMHDTILALKAVHFELYPCWEDLKKTLDMLADSTAACFEIEDEIDQSGMDLYFEYLQCMQCHSAEGKKRAKKRKRR